MNENKLKMVAISCKVKDLLDEIAKTFPTLKKGAFVEELIVKAYNEMIAEKGE